MYAPAMAGSTTQPPGGPDELERIRHARGEGWQWHRIQEEPCPQCGHNPAALPDNSLGDRVVGLAGAWRDFLTTADDDYLRRIPEPGVFSPIQYGAHVDGMLTVAGDRVQLGLDQESPVVPIFNPGQDEWVKYNAMDAEDLASDLEGHARRLATILDGIESAQWTRTVVNDRGQYGIYTFTLAGLGRNAVHEAHHHLLDAKGTLSLGAMP